MFIANTPNQFGAIKARANAHRGSASLYPSSFVPESRRAIATSNFFAVQAALAKWLDP